jgi:Flp pilus assembly protein TadG
MKRLLRNQAGNATMQFAIVAPVLFAFIIAVAQLGQLFFANAGLKSAVAEGARYASLFPKPTNAQIVAKITDSGFGLVPANITAPTAVDCTAGTRKCVDIQMSYQVPLDLIFFQWGTINLVERRRVIVS